MEDNAAVMLPRFYAPDLDPERREARLPATEARHLTRVLRLGVADEVAVFDGRGREFRARVAHVARDDVRVTLIAAIVPAPEPRVRLTLAQAVLKADRMDDVVRDAVMMGVERIDPIVTAHIAVKESVALRPSAADRWRRVVVASVKQCRRATVPVVGDPRRFEDWLKSRNEEMKLLLVEPSAADDDHPLSIRSLSRTSVPRSVALIVGPEGGWSPQERRAAIEAGCLAITLGSLTLRADAVPIAAIAVIRFVFEDL